MTVMKWMSCIVPILEVLGRAQGQAIVQIQVQRELSAELRGTVQRGESAAADGHWAISLRNR
jgi:hypothetical protein